MPRASRNGAGGAGAANENNNEGNARLVGLTPLGERPISQLVASGAFRGMPAALVQQTLAVMPGLAARGPQAARGARALPAVAAPAAAGGGGGGGGALAAAQAGALAANAAIGGAAAPAIDRWDPRVPHYELERGVVVMDVPMRITEFNELVSISLDGLVRPVVNLLYGGEVNGEAVRELVEITTDSIRPALENFVEQLSSRSIAARIAIDTTRHRAYIDRLATTSRGTHRAEIIRQLQEEYNETIQPLGPALETDPSIAQRTWAFFTRSPPPAQRGPNSLLFQPTAAQASIMAARAAAAGGGAVGPVVPPVVGAAAIPAGVGGAVAGYIPSERDIRRRDLIVRQKLRRTYEAAAKFAQNYRVPNQENVLARCPNIMKSLYTNILTALVEYTTVLIHTIRYRVDRTGVLDRAHSTAGAQAAIAEENGDNQVELTFQNLRGVRFLSRDQIDNLMDQLILIAVNYMNISPEFRNLLPLISEIYGISTVYVVVADGDQDRGIEGAVLGAVFSEHLQQLVADITREAVVMSDRYVINGNAWFNTDGLAGKLGALGSVVDKFTLGIGSKLTSAVAKSSVAKMFSKTTLAKLVLPTKRVQVQTSTEASADGRRTHTTTVGRQTHYAVAAEAAGILGDIAHPVWVAFDRLLELVDPVEFNQTMELTDGSRRAVRGNLRVAAEQAVEIGADVASGVVGIMSRLNRGLHGRLAALGASGHAQTIVTALAGLDDDSAAMVMREVADQGSYQQMRATLLATQGSPNTRELEAMQGTPLSRKLAQALREGTTFTPMYVSVTGQRVPNTQWDRYAVFFNFYKAFTKYSVAEEGTGRYNDFSAYIHSPLIYPHLLRFGIGDLLMMQGPIMAMEQNAEWNDRYGEIMRLVQAAIESKETLGAALANQSDNDDSYHPSVNNYNSNGNSNNSNGNGNNGYAENVGPFAPNAAGNNNQNNNANNDDYGYTNGHDVISGIKYIIHYGNTSTVRETPEYISWTTYVDSVQFSQWLDSFTNAQLDNLEQEIRLSLLYKFNDPLAVRLLGYVVDERSNPVRRPRTLGPSGPQTGFASFFPQPTVNRNDDRDRDAALAALSNNPTFAAFYNALMWYDEEEYGTGRFMRFRKFVQNALPGLIGSFTDEELTQLNEYAYASMTQDHRYDDLVQIISQVEIARANGNYGMNNNEGSQGSQRSRQTNNTEGYNNNGPMGAMAGPEGIDRSLVRLNNDPRYGNFYDTLLWFDEEDYGSQHFMEFQQFIQTRLRQIIITFTDEQLETIWNIILETMTNDDRYDNITAIIGRERGRRGQRGTMGRVNFNALAREPAEMSRSRSRNSNNTFSSLNSAERRHWELFPNNIENALRPGTMADPMESYSAAKYKSKMAKSKKKSPPKSKTKSKSKTNRGSAARKTSRNGGGGGGGGGSTRKRSATSKARSSGARNLERNIRLALAGEAKGWGASGPEQDARLHFEHQGGLNQIRNSNSRALLKAILKIKPSSQLRKQMIQNATHRIGELPRSANQSNNSYNTPKLNSR